MKHARHLVPIVVLAVACGSGGDAVQSSPGTSTTSTTTDTSTTSAVTNSSTATSPSTSDSASATTSSTPPDPGVHRVAPAGPWAPPGLILFDAGSARKQGHTGEFSPVVNEPVHEIAEVPLEGFVFQSEPRSQRIWLEAGDGPTELLVAAPNQGLTLEGVVLDDAEVPHVLYQRHTSGDVEQTVSVLRSYNTETGEVTDVAGTGGWESGTSFGHITGNDIVGRWSSEGFVGLTRLDLETGEETYNTVDDPRLDTCFDGDRDCPDYRAATVWDGVVLGIGTVWNDQAGYVDALGLYQFDEFSGTHTLLLSWPWDNGVWYPEDMWVAGDLVVVSIEDGDFAPLPGLVIDMSTGDSWTLPSTGFVRPGWLS